MYFNNSHKFNLLVSIICFIIVFILIFLIAISTVEEKTNHKSLSAIEISNVVCQDDDYPEFDFNSLKHIEDKNYYYQYNNNVENIAEILSLEISEQEEQEEIIKNTVINFQANSPAISNMITDTYLADKLNITYTITNNVYYLTNEEINNIATIIQLEVIGANSNLYDFDDTSIKYWEMLAVAQCVRNRMESNKFPDTVNGVIFDSHTVNGKTVYQFSPASVIHNYIPTEEAITAAKEIFNEGVTVTPSNYYFFCASSIETRFERGNAYCLVLREDNTYDKIQGHLTTFYAGKN